MAVHEQRALLNAESCLSDSPTDKSRVFSAFKALRIGRIRACSEDSMHGIRVACKLSVGHTRRTMQESRRIQAYASWKQYLRITQAHKNAHLQKLRMRVLGYRFLFAIVVETNSCLSSQLISPYHFAEKWMRSVFSVAELLVKSFHDCQANVQSDEIA